jgi:hypothetical protein
LIDQVCCRSRREEVTMRSTNKEFALSSAQLGHRCRKKGVTRCLPQSMPISAQFSRKRRGVLRVRYRSEQNWTNHKIKSMMLFQRMAFRTELNRGTVTERSKRRMSVVWLFRYDADAGGKVKYQSQNGDYVQSDATTSSRIQKTQKQERSFLQGWPSAQS